MNDDIIEKDNRMTILLDMDGVLADFQGWLFKKFNLDINDKTLSSDYDITKALGISKAEFYKWIDKQDKVFEDLDILPKAKDLIKLCKKYTDNVVIASSPFRKPETWSEKIVWLRKHGINLKVMLGHHKELMSRYNTILIDDKESNIEKFELNEGWGILYPARTNSNNDIFYEGNELKYTKNMLDDFSTMVSWRCEEKRCEFCNCRFKDNDDICVTAEGKQVCKHCYEDVCTICDDCGKHYISERMWMLGTEIGLVQPFYICKSCLAKAGQDRID